MAHPSGPSHPVVRSWILRCREKIARISISKWMLLLVGMSLCGYGIFGFEYYTAAKSHRDLLQNNSVYMEFERQVRDAAATFQIASLAAANAEKLPQDIVKSAARSFAEAARSAAKTNRVPALQPRFESILRGVVAVEEALSTPALDVERLRTGLDSAGQTLDLLVLIAEEGRKAEWVNLMEGSRSNFVSLLTLIAACALFVSTMGYLITAHITRTFAAVIRINSSVANGKLDVQIPAGNAYTEAGQFYGALHVFRKNAQEKARLEIVAQQEEAARATRHKKIETQIDLFASGSESF